MRRVVTQNFAQFDDLSITQLCNRRVVCYKLRKMLEIQIFLQIFLQTVDW